MPVVALLNATSWLAAALACFFAMACGSNQDSSASGDTTTVSTGNRVANTQSNESLKVVNGVGHLPLTGCASADYFAAINVGGQPFNLLLDSGSTTVAVASSACSSCGVPSGYSMSSTATSTGLKASSQYLDGSGWSGTIYSDLIAGGDATKLVTPAVGVKFAAITAQDNFFEEFSCVTSNDVAFDGILGVGPDTLLEKNTTSFLTGLAQSGKLAADVFALQACDVGGNVWFGGVNSNAMTGVPSYTPMLSASAARNPNVAYEVAVSGMGLGTSSFGLASTALGPMVIDNGTSVIILPTAAFQAFENLLNQNAAYIQNFGQGFISASNGECASAQAGLTRAQIDAQLPSLTITLPNASGGTFTLTMPPTSSYLVAGHISTDTTNTPVYCPSITHSSSISLLGMVGMRDFIVIFDRANQRVGFAQQVGCQQSLVTYFEGTGS